MSLNEKEWNKGNSKRSLNVQYKGRQISWFIKEVWFSTNETCSINPKLTFKIKTGDNYQTTKYIEYFSSSFQNYKRKIKVSKA